MKKKQGLCLLVAGFLLLPMTGCGTPGVLPESSWIEDEGFGVSDTPALSDPDTTTTMAATTTAATTTTTTTATTTTKAPTTTTTKKPTTTTTTQPKIDVNGPEYEGYRLVRDAVEKIKNKQYFSVFFRCDTDTYEGGQYTPFIGYEADGIFAPKAPLSTHRYMWMYCHGPTLFMCQHSNTVYYHHIKGHNADGSNIWAYNKFSTDSVTNNLALGEASAAEMRHLPSATHAIHAKIEPNTMFALSGNRGVTFSVPADEFKRLFGNSIEFSNFILLEPDKTLEYVVKDAQLEYIITADGYLYAISMMYHMDVSGTKDGQPYQTTLRVCTSMRLSNYNKDNPPSTMCKEPENKEYEEIADPGWVYNSTIPYTP